jgi:outer membrane receptor protein involved in Fe transport
MRRSYRSINGSVAAATWGLVALTGAAAAGAAEQVEVEEIVVTASRRAQEVQNVPASVAVIDPQAFSAGGVTSLTGVLKYVPGVNFNDDGAPGQGSITMRGVANIFSTPSVGIYLDDIPYGSVTAFAEGANFALDSLLGNVERVEVIKGPQGTLFGAASMGGSLRYITKEPSLTDFKARFAIDMSDTAQGGFNQLYKAGVDVPIISDKLSVGVSGFYQDNEGFIDQANRPEENVNDAELKGGQATVLFKPTDDFKVRLNYMDQKFDFSEQNSVPFDITTGEPLLGRYQQNTAAGGQPTQIEYELTSATFEYQADWATATLASSYQEFAQNAILDLTRFFGPLVDAQAGDPPGTNTVPLELIISTDRWAHEFRLTSANNEHLEWLVGLYYTKEESSNFQKAVGQPSGFNLVTQEFPSDYKEKAVFGNVTYYFTPQLDATLGARFSSNDMSVLFTGTGFLAGPALPRQTVSDDVQTYLFNARYRPNDDLSLYVRIADGYRPASANLPLLDPSTGDVISLPFVKADSLWSYEVGAKGKVAGGAVGYDVAVYRIKWEDLQVFQSLNGVNVGTNASSDVTADGIEATLTLQPTRGLNLVASAAYALSELDDDDPIVGGLSGEQLPGIPEWTFSLSGDYDFMLGSLDAFVGGGVAYQDQRKTSFNGGVGAGGVVIEPANTNFDTDDYVTVDLRTGVRFGRYELSLYATNLFDEYGFQRATTVGTQGNATILRPRTIGAVFSAEF